MRDIQDVDGNAQLLEDGKAVSESAAPSSTLVAKEAGARRRHMRKAQRLLVFNVGLGILLGLCAASFCIKPGFGYPWMPHRLQRVLLLLFAWELLLFFVAPPVCLLWRLASATGSDQRSDKQRDSVCVLLLAVCEFGCGVCASAMSAFSIYTGKILLAQDATNGFITLLSFGMGACLPFSLFGNPKFRNAKKINSRAARAGTCTIKPPRKEAIGEYGNVIGRRPKSRNRRMPPIALYSIFTSDGPAKVLGAAEYPVMFVGALLLVKSLAHFTRELLHHRKAASGASMHPEH